MKTEWRFNGSAQLILIPENARDKQMIQLAFDGRPELRIKPTTGEETIIEMSAVTWCKACAHAKALCVCEKRKAAEEQRELERQSA